MTNEPAPDQVDIAIIGGGIGGTVAAVALNKLGYDAHVFEQAPALGEVGGHLTIDTAAIEILERHGLATDFHKIACPLNGIEVRNMQNGDVLAHFQMPDLASMGVDDPNRHGSRVVHAFLRADFINMAVSHLPHDRIHTGYKLVALENTSSCANATFENGRQVKANYLIAADGVKSIARTMFDDVDPVPAGINICRANVKVDALPEDMPADRMRFYDGWAFGDMSKNIGTHVLFCPVRKGELLSVDFNLHGADLLEDCDPWNLPLDRILSRLPDGISPLIPALAEARIEPFAGHLLYDRPVAKKWTENRIAILGDAAHAMRPTLGQGACQSIHDAGEIVACIQEYGLSEKALSAYEDIRRPYVQSIVDVAKNTKVDPKAWKDRS